jgi:hypothetical protein
MKSEIFFGCKTLRNGNQKKNFSRDLGSGCLVHKTDAGAAKAFGTVRTQAKGYGFRREAMQLPGKNPSHWSMILPLVGVFTIAVILRKNGA